MSFYAFIEENQQLWKQWSGQVLLAIDFRAALWLELLVRWGEVTTTKGIPLLAQRPSPMSFDRSFAVCDKVKVREEPIKGAG